MTVTPSPRPEVGAEASGSGPVILRRMADAVTLARIALIPGLLFAAESTRSSAAAGMPTSRTTVVVLLLVMGASDNVDGFLARRSGTPPSRRGAFLDAAADRLMRWGGVWFFALRASPAFTPLPLWLAVVVSARDLLLVVVWLGRGPREAVSLEHEAHGKVTTVAMFLVLLGATTAAPPGLVIAAAAITTAMMIYSTLRYAARTRSGALH